MRQKTIQIKFDNIYAYNDFFDTRAQLLGFDWIRSQKNFDLVHTLYRNADVNITVNIEDKRFLIIDQKLVQQLKMLPTIESFVEFLMP